MQFKVPQFLDIEDKAIGPLTWSQLAWCVGAVSCMYLGFRFTDSNILGFTFGAVPSFIFLALAFIKINNRPFLDMIQNAIMYYLNNNLYIWRSKSSKINTIEDTLKKIEERKVLAVEQKEKDKNKKIIDIKGLAKRLDESK